MSIRTKRVAELVQREVAKILQREYASQLQPMVTITDARVTPDLSIAYLYASVLGDKKQQREATFRHLETLGPEIRDALASEVSDQLRIVPELKFFLDETHQRVERLNSLFDQIQEEREDKEGAEEEPATEKDA